jgi:hypothetical protein
LDIGQWLRGLLAYFGRPRASEDAAEQVVVLVDRITEGKALPPRSSARSWRGPRVCEDVRRCQLHLAASGVGAHL